MRTQLTLALMVLGGGVAHANAFYLSEHDAKATGRGDTGAATDTDPSAIFYNPGGVPVDDGTHISVGAAVITPEASFTPDPQYNAGKIDSTTQSQIVPNVFATYKVNSLVAVGVGVHAPFGLEIDWPSNVVTASQSTQTALRSYFISGVAGVDLNKIIPGLSAGAGIDIVPGTIELKQQIFFGEDSGTAHLGGTGTGFGARAGVMYRPALIPQLSVGVMYASQVKIDFSGSANFDAPPPYRSQLPPDGDISTTITLPQRVVGGAADRPVEHLEIEANVSWVNWAKFSTLDIQLPNGMTQVQPESYHNTTSLRVGAEYGVPALHMAFRVGYIFDPTPIDTQHLTAQLPDVDRNDLTAGATYVLGDYDVHVGLLWVLPTSRSTANDMTMPNAPPIKGTFDVSAVVAAVQVSGKFGK